MSAPLQTKPARPRIDGLDGLRAFAVIGVLLYHADVPWAKGGFVGVDVFFVLSGYLVTSIVLSGFEKTGELGFRRFWANRFRRLEPAQITMLVVITLAVALFYRKELADLPGQVVAALTGTMNWYLIATNGSYFEQLGRPPVFRHLWSLAVELQFYLVFPPILIFSLKRWGNRLDRILLALGGTILASTLWMAFLYHPDADPTRAYFDTFARLAAPLTGAALALVWRPRSLARGQAAELGGPLTVAGGLGLVGLLWILHAAGDRSAMMYRGGFLLAALVSALVVASVVHPRSHLGSRYGLGHPWLVAIGLRSYGLYLWHWPVYDLLRPGIDVGWSWGMVFFWRIALTVGLTELCYRLVERPWHLRAPDASLAGLRRRLFQPSGIPTRTRVGTLSAVLGTFLAIAILVVPHQKDDAIADSLRAGEAALATTTTGATTSTRPGETTTTVAGKVPDDGRVTLVGDSVMLGSAPDILATLGTRAIVDAKVSRQAAELPPIIRQLGLEGRLGSTVVVQVGINGTVTEEELRDIAAAAPGRRLFIINPRVPRSWQQENLDTVKRVVPKLPRATIIDWYKVSAKHMDWFLNDGVHLTPEGRQAYADMIKRAVDRKEKATSKRQGG
ncbi:MAG: acyltransferase family protein [Acidimicrobiales bacterium]